MELQHLSTVELVQLKAQINHRLVAHINQEMGRLKSQMINAGLERVHGAPAAIGHMYSLVSGQIETGENRYWLRKEIISEGETDWQLTVDDQLIRSGSDMKELIQYARDLEDLPANPFGVGTSFPLHVIKGRFNPEQLPKGSPFFMTAQVADNAWTVQVWKAVSHGGAQQLMYWQVGLKEMSLLPSQMQVLDLVTIKNGRVVSDPIASDHKQLFLIGAGGDGDILLLQDDENPRRILLVETDHGGQTLRADNELWIELTSQQMRRIERAKTKYMTKVSG
jgi:hypothetical protein